MTVRALGVLGALGVVVVALGVQFVLQERRRRDASVHDSRGSRRSGAQALSKEQRKAAKRASRREKKDEQLARKKVARADIRAHAQLEMTAEQKREQMERIKMQRVEQYVRPRLLLVRLHCLSGCA